ncbi:unnamed protein product, partial [Oppiella nova]
MEYCSHTLKNIIALKGPEFARQQPGEPMNAIEYFISCEIFKELLECVQYLHDLNEGVVLRDLRSDNILIAENGRNGRYIKLSNFGCAIDDDDYDSERVYGSQDFGSLADSGQGGGGSHSVHTNKADIYSVGVIAQELFDMDIHDPNPLQKYLSHELIDNFAKLFKVFVSMMVDVSGQTSTCAQVIGQYYDWSIDKDLSQSCVGRGLVIDKRRGNVLKLNSEFGIMSVRHGFQELSSRSTREVYGGDDVVRALRTIPDVLCLGTINTTESEGFDYAVLKSYFTSPAAQVFSKCVEVLDITDDNTVSDDNNLRNRYAKIWRDIYSSTCLMYGSGLNHRSGGWNPELMDTPDRYLRKTSDRVIQLLKMWRQSGKHVILITSSDADHTKLLMNYAFG